MVSKLILFVSLICVSVCIKEPFQHLPDGCVIHTDQGVIDLTPLGSKYHQPTFKDVVDRITNLYSYSWNPCFAFNEGNCHNVSICQKLLALDSYEILGYPEQVTFQEVEGHTGALVYRSTDQLGQQRVSTILLTCEPILDGIFEAFPEDPILNYKFELKSKYACPNPLTPPPPVTGGSVTATVPTPHPKPGIFSIKIITILLFSIQCSLVVIVILLIVAVVSQITRRYSSSSTSGVPEKLSFAYKQMD
ncbi:hypothetical protein LOTGIDRAFT_236982 [Lottia gigantea]|uniref:MRH domain-containing protein n=1 Tax=Lottia gigantea TaxID=225164 RepID=V3ZNR6_LOTGI|nr:hypothetical protein LOTGIDRAFT_236982 [Lottia gigantea]ESO82506.1 hypothetical protein LOTGIDRAFT_236982 [Lottia gigantea]